MKKYNLNLRKIIERIIIQFIISIACWHIITIWFELESTYINMLLSFFLSFNILWLDDFYNWFIDVTNNLIILKRNDLKGYNQKIENKDISIYHFNNEVITLNEIRKAKVILYVDGNFVKKLKSN